MRWATYRSQSSQSDRVGLVKDGSVHGLSSTESLLDLLGDDGTRLRAAAERATTDPLEVVELDKVELRAPIPRPPSIRDFMAFEAHVATAGEAMGRPVHPDWYELPVFYFSNPVATIGARDAVAISPGCATFDYELEVAAIVGHEGADLHPDEAEACIAGYVVMCDWSARDLQFREMQQGLGPAKGKDSATSFGPMLVTPEELVPHKSGKSYALEMRAIVNGKLYSRGVLSDIHWTFGQLLAFASRGTKVVPGDVIGSGTVGTGCILELSLVHGNKAYPWLLPGDEVVLEVDMLGAITSRVVAGAEVIPLK